MAWQWTPYMIPLIVGGVMSVISALYTWQRHQRSPMAGTAALVLLASAEWTLGYAMELGA